MKNRLRNFEQEALQKAKDLYEKLNETDKQAFLNKFSKPIPHKMLHWSPTWASELEKFELLLLEAQDYFQKVYHNIDYKYIGIFYAFFLQCTHITKTTQPVKDWYLPESYTEDDWREVVEVERFIRLTKLKKYFEWGTTDIENVLSFKRNFSISAFDTLFVLDFEYFAFSLLPYNDGTNTEGHPQIDLSQCINKIYTIFSDISTPNPQGRYKELLLDYMFKQQMDFEDTIRQVEARKETSYQNMKQLQQNYTHNRLYASRVKIDFEIELNTGVFIGSLDTNRYVWTVWGFVILAVTLLLVWWFNI